MRRVAVLMMMAMCASPGRGAQDWLSRGEQVFNRSCANSLCHAREGSSGSSAPRLAERGFDEGFIARTIRVGREQTSMPGFETVLPREDLLAVIAYVDKLNGLAASANPPVEVGAKRPAPAVTLPAKSERGRRLFADATRGVGACSSCHRVQNQGIAVSESLHQVPKTVALLRALKTPKVVTVRLNGQFMPALMLSKGKEATIFYDLTVSPPVLNTREPASVSVQEGSEWDHARFLAGYNDDELDAILDYLRAIQSAQVANVS